MIDFEKYMIVEEGLFSKTKNQNKSNQDEPDPGSINYKGKDLTDMIYKGIVSLEMREGSNLNKPGHLAADQAGLKYINAMKSDAIEKLSKVTVGVVHGKRLYGLVISKQGLNAIKCSDDIQCIVFPKIDESGEIKKSAYSFSTLVYYYYTDMMKRM